MDRAVDLSAALAFAINRIEEQAMRSGQPLDEEVNLHYGLVT